MKITLDVLDELTEKAKVDPRLRYHLDLRDSEEDQSQRMLNAIEPGTVIPIHRHKNTSETMVCIRGHFEEYLYDYTRTLEDGTPDPESFGVVEVVDMVPVGTLLIVEPGQWHTLKSLESGTVLLSAKDGAWEPLENDDIFEGGVNNNPWNNEK